MTPPSPRKPRAPKPQPILTVPCAQGRHRQCTGRVLNAQRGPGQPRFIACQCPHHTEPDQGRDET